MKISKDDFDLVKRKFGDDGDNLTWTDGEVLIDGGSRPEELVEEMQGLARRFHFREDPMGFVDNLSRECAERENWKKSVFNQTPRELSKRKIKGLTIPHWVQVFKELCDVMQLWQSVEGTLIPVASFEGARHRHLISSCNRQYSRRAMHLNQC